MRTKLFRAIGIIALLFCVIFTSSNSYATNSIEDAKEEKEKLEAELKNTEKKIQSLQALKNDTKAYIKKMDSYIEELVTNIASIENDVAAKKLAIEAKQAEIVEIEKDIANQYETMKLRIKYMYENGNVSYVSMFFESEDMSDFLNRAEYLAEITEYDREMLLRLQDTEKNLKIAKSTLDSEYVQLNEMLAEVEAEKEATDVLIASKRAELTATDANLSEQEAAKLQHEEDIKAQEEYIKELEEIERKRKEQEALLQNAIGKYDGSGMMWPVPGYSRISSSFGYRSDPFTGEKSYHSGTDIPAPTGTKIVAAYKGQVAWSYYSSSAGNWIGIDHGNGLYTVYMHMSKLLVKEGQMVNTGDVIGLCGSTGRSTGPHLHFSVRLNGNYVEPLNYVSP